MRAKMTVTMEPKSALTPAVLTSPPALVTGLTGAVTPEVLALPPVTGGLVIISSVVGVTSVGSTGPTGVTGSTPGQVDASRTHATPVSHSSVVTMAEPPRKL